MDGKIDTVREDDMCQVCEHVYIAELALSALSAIDPEAIRRECAYKAKQAILSAPYDNPTRAYAAALAEAAILATEPAQDDGKPESEESRDERLATKQLLGAGCHDECGDLPEEDK